jgi:aryl-alcohol dehydrogenase-like predicted oxidoreductase
METMTTRELGASGLKVSPLCLGGNVFGWTIDESTSFAILNASVDAGLNFIDTADVYSKWVPGNQGGESETIIGKWLKAGGQRSRIVLATKVGLEMGPGRKGLSKAYILRSVEESLGRLQTDYIDLYQSHTDDTDTPLEETLATYDQLIREGKVRAIGASNYRAERLAAALEVSLRLGYPRYECLQPLYNLYDREDFEKNLERLCVANHLAVIPYFSLASGFLTGKYRSEADLSKSQRGSGIKKYLDARGFRILDALNRVAEKYNSTQAKVSLAWLIARPSITAPIASATSVQQLKELVEATQMKLDAGSIELLNQASA